VRVDGTDVLRDPASGDVRPMSADAWLYLDRTVASYRGLHGDGEALPSWDPDLSCPTGTAPPWPHGLNLLGAAVATAVQGSDASDAEVRTAASWIPPVVGAVACVLVLLLGAAAIDPIVGLLAGLLLALLPIHVWNTAFSTLDHHIFAPIVPLLAIWGLRDGMRSARMAPFVWAGIALGVGHWCWTESWFWQAAVVGVGFFGALFGAPIRRRSVALKGVAIMAVVAAFVALPGILTAPYYVHDRVAPHAPSRFSLWANAAVAAAALAAWFGRRRDDLPVLGAAVIGAVVIVAASFSDPAMRAAYEAMAGFAGRGGVVGLIDESKPLLARDFPQPFLLLSGAIVIAPALPFAWTRLPGETRWLLGTWLVVSLALSLLQSRFALVFAVPFCLALATLLVHGVDASIVPRGRLLRIVAAIGAATVLLSFAMRGYWTTDKEVRWQFLGQLGAKMATVSAPAASPNDERSRRCLIGPWNLGHQLHVRGGMSVVAHNFTEHADREAIIDVDRALFGHLEALPALFERRLVRWLWVDARDHADIGAHRQGLGGEAAPDLRQTAWWQLILGRPKHPSLRNAKLVWTSPLAVEITPLGPGTQPIAVPRDRLYVLGSLPWATGR